MTKLRVTLIAMGAAGVLMGVMTPAAGAPGPLTGSVILEGEEALAGVEVFVFDPDQGPLFTCTDKNGEFEFESVSDSEGFIAATGLGMEGRCDNWKFQAPDGEDLLNEYYNGHSGVKRFDPFSRKDGPIDFLVERVNGRAACLGLLHTLAEMPTNGPDRIVGTSGDDVIAGLAGNDKIFGKGGNDILCGDSGRDKLYPGSGQDILDGGTGKDWSLYSSAKRAVTVKLNRGWAKGQGRDVLISIESVSGSDFDDLIVGNSKTNSLKGRDGKDTIFAKGGTDFLYGNQKADELFGGSGLDTAFGGSGRDTCVAEVEFSC